MKKIFTGLRVILFSLCLVTIAVFAFMLVLVEKTTEAEKTIVEVDDVKYANNNTNNYVKALQRVEKAYSNINDVKMKADIKVRIFKPDGVVEGEGTVEYFADGVKYKYKNSISATLEKEGLMRNLDFIYDSNKFYMYDRESKILSYQNEGIPAMPSAFPNPFFLPIDFYSQDDDKCPLCRLQLRDFKGNIDRKDRFDSLVELSNETNSGFIHSNVKMQGGKLQGADFDYNLRFVGTSNENIFPKSVERVNKEERKLLSIILNDARTVENFDMEFPYSIEIASYDENGIVTMSAIVTIKTLQINQGIHEDEFNPDFDSLERIWNSDSKEFVDSIQ